MTTLSDKLDAAKPRAISLSEIPPVPELTASGTGEESLGGKPKLIASLDPAFTVHCKVYVGTPIPPLTKEKVLVCDDKSMRPITGKGGTSDGMRKTGDGLVIITSYDFWPKGFKPKSRNPDDWDAEEQAKVTSVITYAPAKAEIDAWKISF